LLALVLGAAVPLAALGLWGLRREWITSREHLNELVGQEAELAAVTFERWVDAQQQPLFTTAAATEQSISQKELQDELRFIMAPRPDWIDVRVLDASGSVVASEPVDAEPLPDSLWRQLVSDIRDHQGPVVETDWRDTTRNTGIAIGARIKGNGVVIARINSRALNGLFSDISLQASAMLTVHDEQRRIIYSSSDIEKYAGTDLTGSELFAPPGQPSAIIEAATPVDGVRRIYGLARAGSTHYTAVVGVPSASLYEPAWRELTRYLLFSFLALLCTGIAALVIARGIAGPLGRLTNVVHRFGAGDLQARAPAGGGSEIAELSYTFNTMASQIKEREERLTELDRLKSEFVSGVSHELRTPLTTIKTLTRVMQHGGETEQERRQYLETIAAQCDRQIDLVLNLLDLSRIESGALNLDLDPVDIAELIRTCVKIETPAAELHGHALREFLPKELSHVSADRSALRRVVCSLIENAIKYTPNGGSIIISGSDSSDGVEITVSDNGRGIAVQDQPHVFEKFFRGRPYFEPLDENGTDESSDDTDVPGVGLGLYLANSLVMQMRGTIGVESGPGNGSSFTVCLPFWHNAMANDRSPYEGIKNGETVTSGGR
jgi:signal transduction histidine kinase